MEWHYGRGFLWGTVLALTVAVAGCTGEGETDGTVPGTTPSETLSDDESVNPSEPPCEAVAGTTFRSIVKLDSTEVVAYRLDSGELSR